MQSTIPSITAEFEGLDLGDKRLNARAISMAEAFSLNPEASLPTALQNESAAEAAYRLLNNDYFSHTDLLRPHISATLHRVSSAKKVLVVHDTTEMVFGGLSQRDGLEDDRFRAHLSFSVSADSRREPLGVLAMHTWVRAGVKGKRSTESRLKDEHRESKRWLRQSIAVEKMVTDTVLIHVEDREADIFESIATRLAHGMHFIVRAQHCRMVQDDEGLSPIVDFIEKQPVFFERHVHLSRRQVYIKTTNSNKTRKARDADLEVRATMVQIRRPSKGHKEFPEFVSVNLVYVIEPNPPVDQEPVEWLLMSTEPIQTVENVEFIIDSYRARWVIEEYFKVIKTGCTYESLQLESYDALLKALSFYLVIAWRLLWMRSVAHHAPDEPVTAIATAVEIAVVSQMKGIKKLETVKDFLSAIASVGGHFKSNGPPGWQVLWRGYKVIRERVEGYNLANKNHRARCDQ